ncbi:phosphoribosyltransferase [Leptolyngbya sp. PCC 6406]|uniref:phosphoribosyltransferase n=1 Tax=Leptolyngbya sp. PCC 6406 TaxID=1173264 RepID=UPI0002AC9422|nr:phosphoribosyltransferase family protein [Leptolyngbya sp. PCC 6406]
MVTRFPNRAIAGQQLAQQLLSQTAALLPPTSLVLALPRGGVPVAHAIATTLDLPLELWLVRKLGVPGQPELAMGALALPRSRLLNTAILAQCDVSPRQVELVTDQEYQELHRRNQLYRQGRPAPSVTGRTVILVDDGIATGATMQVAVSTLSAQHPAAIVIAVPVASPMALRILQPQVAQILCPLVPEFLRSISLWYDNFDQTSDDEVQTLLQSHSNPN